MEKDSFLTEFPIVTLITIRRLNSEKFQNLQFLSLNIVIFEENHKNNNSGEFTDFYELTLYVILKIFQENSH